LALTVLPVHQAFAKALEAGVPIERLSFSSDAQGSLPIFDENGQLVGLDVGKAISLFETVRNAVNLSEIPFHVALQTITSTPARLLKLTSKGSIGVGLAADLVMINPKYLAIDTVIARGQVMVENGLPTKHGTFEKPNI